MKTLSLLLMMFCCSSAQGADLTARDVVSQLFATRAQTPIDLSGKNFDNLDLAGVDFKRANLRGVSFFGTDLTAANLTGCNLEGANLNRAILTKTNFSNANLRSASIRRPSIFANMSSSVAEAPSFQGANLEKAWLEGIFDYTVFSEAHLAGARFGALNPRDSQGIIMGPRLRSANFVMADLQAVILERADLSFANLSGARLDGVNLRNANLSRANFQGASLRNADLSSTLRDGANWTNAALPAEDLHR